MASIRDIDKGYRALFKRLHGPNRVLSVGVLSEAAGGAHGNTTVGDIATINEFGLGVPERSFIRSWADENESKNRDLLRAIGKRVIEGKTDADTGLNQAGAVMAGGIQAKIAGGVPPPNAPSTVARKGSSTPLVDTGVLRSSISWKVE